MEKIYEIEIIKLKNIINRKNIQIKKLKKIQIQAVRELGILGIFLIRMGLYREAQKELNLLRMWEKKENKNE